MVLIWNDSELVPLFAILQSTWLIPTDVKIPQYSYFMPIFFIKSRKPLLLPLYIVNTAQSLFV